MKILIDENLSWKLVKLLSDIFDEAVHVRTLNLQHKPDGDLWGIAKANNWAILTQDNDFQFFSSKWGCPPKVIRLNCGNKATVAIAHIIRSKVVAIHAFADSEDCYLEII